MPILTGAILSRFETVIEATPVTGWRQRFAKAHSRFDWTKIPDGGRDGTFRVDLQGELSTTRQVFGTGEVIRNLGRVAVRIAYFRGGGGPGDKKQVNKRVLDDAMALAVSCEDSDTYDSANTGIRVVKYIGFDNVIDERRHELWEVTFDVEWTAETVQS